MSNWIEPPPPQPRRTGCLAKGCVILCCFILFLIVAAAVGLYFGLKNHSALLHTATWMSKTHLVAAEPSPVPQFQTTEENIAAAQRKWDNFEATAENGEPAYIELTADDLNNLIAGNRHVRGKAFVTIRGNRLQLQVSLPLSALLARSGYYLNGDIVVQTNGAQSLRQARLNSIVVNGQPVPSEALDWKYKAQPLRKHLQQYTAGYGTIEIRDGKLIISKSTG
jgi:hypothetical protein